VGAEPAPQRGNVAVYRFAGMQLDRGRHELKGDGVVIPVEPQVFTLLVHLLENRDRVVSKEELLDSIWGTRFVTESTLTSRIKAARRAVGDDGRRQWIIRTVHGVGYRLVAEAVEVEPNEDRVGAGPSQGPAGNQEIGFCWSPDGVCIARATHGQGPPLVKAANWLTHLDYDWQSPVWRHWLEALGRRYQVIRYDERGCGLSDWDVDDFSLDTWVQDLETVVGDVGVDRFPLLGISQGAAVAIAYAVRHPERVSHLILYGSYARGWLANGGDERRHEQAQLLIDLARLGWGRRSPAFRQVFSSAFMPEGTRQQWQDFDELQRRSTSPDNAARFLQAFFELDVTELADQVRTPTLVLHSRGDQVWPFALGRQLAARIPASRFVPLESSNHLILEDEPAWPQFLSEIERFLST